MEKFKITVYENSLLDKEILKSYNPFIMEKACDNEVTQRRWGDLIEITVSIEELKTVQKNMVYHFEGPEPWYAYGYSTEDNNKIVCAFGVDDGNYGKIFIFNKKEDEEKYEDILKYGEEKGIPRNIMDFLSPVK